jgi:hypothetical protein
MHRTAALIAIAAGLTVAGCGSGSPPHNSTASHPSFQNVAAGAYRFAECMRAHGVTNFPDPHVSSGGGQESVAVSLPPKGSVRAPVFRAANRACRGILPIPQNASPAQQAAEQQRHREVLLAFATCMRSHGIIDFPDPSANGQLTLEEVRAAGVDLQAPSTRTAGLACVGVTHGAITAAAVERATSSGATSATSTGAGG